MLHKCSQECSLECCQKQTLQSYGQIWELQKSLYCDAGHCTKSCPRVCMAEPLPGGRCSNARGCKLLHTAQCCTLLQAVALEVYTVKCCKPSHRIASIAQRARTVLHYTFHIALCFVLYNFDEINQHRGMVTVCSTGEDCIQCTGRCCRMVGSS